MMKRVYLFGLLMFVASVCITAVPAQNLEVVEEVERITLDEVEQVYNLSVEGNENYFVSENGVLVHNCSTGPYTYYRGAGMDELTDGTRKSGVFTRKDGVPDSLKPLHPDPAVAQYYADDLTWRTGEIGSSTGTLQPGTGVPSGVGTYVTDTPLPLSPAHEGTRLDGTVLAPADLRPVDVEPWVPSGPALRMPDCRSRNP